jgi:hypothetical protein
MAALDGKALPMEVANGSSDEAAPKEVRKGKSQKQFSSNDLWNGLSGN